VREGEFMPFGPTELLIILVIVLLLFGVGRLSRVGGELGSAVANFRKGISEQKEPSSDLENIDSPR
jgi:sec-independent protein translocase protein TatA